MTDTPLLFRWRDMVLSPSGPPATRRLVLVVLSTHADQDGGSCYPSVRTLAEETGLSRRVVMEHLAEAEAEGWIHRRADGSGQGWRRHSYTLTYPDPARDVVTESDHEGGNGASPRSGEGGHSGARRGHSERTKVVTEGDLSTSVTSSETSPSSPTGSFARDSEPGKGTWVDRAVEVWAERMGGTITHGRVGKALKSAYVEHGEDTVLAVLDNYLAEHVRNGRHRYAKVESLGETFGVELDLYRCGKPNGRGVIADVDPDDLDGWRDAP